jgi:hypothetical protein
MRSRATAFVLRWQNETDERRASQSFWNDFFHIFDIDRRRVAVFEHLSSRYTTGGRGFMDVFWPGYMAGEQKSRGADLTRAMDQALDYLPSIPAEHLPSLVVVSDFARFKVRNQLTGDETDFPIEDLSTNLRLFSPLLDVEQTRRYESEEEVNLAATELLALLHDSLKESGYGGHDLRVLLVRLVFVMFADDSQVWEPGLFYDYLMLHTSVDGSDLGPALIHLFQVLDTPKDRRSPNLDDDLARFEYINGSLFGEPIRIPDCTRGMRNRLVKACRFDWSAISPAIFGSLFQNVMDDAERRNIGAHYTTEQNILRTINPLFMDGLRREMEAARSLPALRQFHNRLAALRFFDPACGCGNFLIIAYREVRRLELEVLRRIRAAEVEQTGSNLRSRSDLQRRPRPGVARGARRSGGAEGMVEGQTGIDISVESRVQVGQFYGIEIEEFPAKIAETAMYLIDHLENLALSAEFGEYYARFPITDTAHIVNDNALRHDWGRVLPAAECDYLFGNPPFHGMAWMNEDQQEDNRRTFSEIATVAVARSGRLDYVACWYAKALDYMHDRPTKAAFVSTNSITQGEQARSLGPALRDAGYQIDFAHRTFKWTSEARGRAQVHVVIIGFSYGRTPDRKILFDYPTVSADEPVTSTPTHINWYLADGPDVFPERRNSTWLPGLPSAVQGSKPWDDGGLIVEPKDIDEVRADPVAARYLRPYRQSTEFLYALDRWCLWLVDATPEDLAASAVLRQRLSIVRDARQRTRTVAVQAQAATPYLFSQIRQPNVRYLALPEVSSENRRFIPSAYLEPEVIAGNKLITISGADDWLFGLLHSSMWMAWVRTISGRMKSDISLAPALAYYAFPFPDRDRAGDRIEAGARALQEARLNHDGSSLATLYNPLAMPADLVRAHQDLDRAVDAAYGHTRYIGDAARLHALFERYVRLTNADALPGVAETPAPRRRRASSVVGQHDVDAR